VIFGQRITPAKPCCEGCAQGHSCESNDAQFGLSLSGFGQVADAGMLIASTIAVEAICKDLSKEECDKLKQVQAQALTGGDSWIGTAAAGGAALACTGYGGVVLGAACGAIATKIWNDFLAASNILTTNCRFLPKDVSPGFALYETGWECPLTSQASGETCATWYAKRMQQAQATGENVYQGKLWDGKKHVEVTWKRPFGMAACRETLARGAGLTVYGETAAPPWVKGFRPIEAMTTFVPIAPRGFDPDAVAVFDPDANLFRIVVSA
jgi:hypothetical protein